MILDRSNSVAVDPLAWHPVRETDRRRQIAERLNSMESLVCKIVAPMERAQAAGRTEDNLAPAVAEWAGNLAKLVTILRVTKRGPVRVLQLQVAHPIAAVELRPRLPQLVAALKDCGISEVRL